MSHINLAHRRTHNLLLISKLLSQREGASPFTLIQDTLEQTANPLLGEYIKRAKISKCQTIFLSFETVVKPIDVDTFIICYNKTPLQIGQVVSAAIATANKRCLIIIDSLTVLATLSTSTKSPLNITDFLSSFLQPPRESPQATIAMVAVYHTDIPIRNTGTPYSPPPQTLLSYLATTIITVHSLPILLAEKQARERSIGPPTFGLAEEKEGVLVGLKRQARSMKPEDRGIVLELEHRRKSGRGVLEWYFLPANASKQQPTMPQAFKEMVILLDDHPLFRRPKNDQQQTSDKELSGMTFELGLTDRQRQERDGVVLPYFDAQKAGGVTGEGGRILYDMGVEDDFDDEEDEI